MNIVNRGMPEQIPLREVTDTVLSPLSRDSRSRLRRLRQLLAENPELKPSYEVVRDTSRYLRGAAVYDITSRCNLWCEGCYYFEGENGHLEESYDLDRWEAHFRAERDRGIVFGYFGGAEPALAQDRLRVAAEYVKTGVIATNGTLKVAEDIPYRIIVSVWGDEDVTDLLRGGNTFWKAIRNFEGDDRALFAYTVTRKNIHQLRQVASILDDHGIDMSFNMYSPTTSYLEKLAGGADNDGEFFRVSSAADNLRFQPGDLEYCRKHIDEVAEEFSSIVTYPAPYNREMTAPAPLYQIDEATGIALDCAGRHNGTHTTFLSNLEQSTAKCCMPNIDCGECRALAGSLSGRLYPRDRDLQNRDTLIDWLEICQYWAWFYLGKAHRPTVRQTVKDGVD